MRVLILLLLASVVCAEVGVPCYRVVGKFTTASFRDNVVAKVNAYQEEFSDKIDACIISESTGTTQTINAMVWANIGARDDLLAVSTTYFKSNNSKVLSVEVYVHQCYMLEHAPCKEYLIYTK